MVSKIVIAFVFPSIPTHCNQKLLHLVKPKGARFELERFSSRNRNDAPFGTHRDLLSTMDAINVGDLPWHSFKVRYTGEVDENSPTWKRETYTIYARNTLDIFRSLLQNTDFKDQFDYRPLEEYVAPAKRR